MRITIILVAPARAENIGAAARAMKTMGFSELRIVDSQAHLEPATRWVAHGSGDIIDNIKVFPTLVESLHDVDFTVATTARSRAKYHYYATPVELVPLLEEKSSWMSHAALVFGREDSGLTNEELALADVLTRVPFSLVTDIGPVVVFSLTMALIVVSSIISKLSAFLPSKATSVAVEKLTPTIVTSVPALPSMGSNESTFGNLDTVNGELSNGLAP